MVLKTKIALALVAFILLHLSCEIQVRNGRKIPGQLVKVYLLTHAFKRSCRNWNFMDVQYWPVNDNQVVFSNRSGSSSCYEFLVGVLWTAWQQQKKTHLWLGLLLLPVGSWSWPIHSPWLGLPVGLVTSTSSAVHVQPWGMVLMREGMACTRATSSQLTCSLGAAVASAWQT